MHCGASFLLMIWRKNAKPKKLANVGYRVKRQITAAQVNLKEKAKHLFLIMFITTK